MAWGAGRTGDNRVLRGGSWINNGRNCRSANRNNNDPGNANNNIGFRLARAQYAVGMSVNDQTCILSDCLNTQLAKIKVAGCASRVSGSYPNARRLAALLLNFLLTSVMRKLSHFPTEFPEAWASEWGEDQFGCWMAFTYKGIKQVFRWIEPGTFEMGSPPTEAERYSDEIQHSVTLSQGYWLADTTVTQALWQAVMEEENPSHFAGETRPLDSVSWNSAQAFIEKMNSLNPALKLCLPTEAQWEYACRAGTEGPFSFGEQIDSTRVNFDGTVPYSNGEASEYRQTSVEVKSLPANDWGLFEMHGNVLEWCQDWYGEYPAETVVDPQGAESGDYRVLRGGSWIYNGRLCRSARRRSDVPGLAHFSIGFRLARGH